MFDLQSLYGVLNMNEKQFKGTSSLNSALTTANEKFNLIPLSVVQHRLELLPILSNQQQQQQQSSQIQHHQQTNLMNSARNQV